MCFLSLLKFKLSYFLSERKFIIMINVQVSQICGLKYHQIFTSCVFIQLFKKINVTS